MNFDYLILTSMTLLVLIAALVLLFITFVMLRPRERLPFLAIAVPVAYFVLIAVNDLFVAGL